MYSWFHPSLKLTKLLIKNKSTRAKVDTERYFKYEWYWKELCLVWIEKNVMLFSEVFRTERATTLHQLNIWCHLLNVLVFHEVLLICTPISTTHNSQLMFKPYLQLAIWFFDRFQNFPANVAVEWNRVVTVAVVQFNCNAHWMGYGQRN